MNRLKFILGLFILIVLTAISSFAQEITVTANAANTVASKMQIDLPLLNGNPNAMIVATPFGNTATLNPHPIGAWYYNNKWNIFNVDHANMPVGASFKVEYFIRADANHFVHVIAHSNAGGYSYIDNPALNNNPTAQVRIFQNHAPDFRAFYLNQNEARIVYDTGVGKWYIENINGKALQPNTAYNVVISSGGTGIINTPKTAVVIPQLNTNPTSANSTCNCPASLPPDGNAGGDLGGVYPNPTVQKINGKPVSNNAPAVGQVLKWNGTAWQPADDNVASAASNAVYKPTFLYYEQSTSGNAPEVNSFNSTAIITGLDNKFFTLTQSSRVVFHTNVALLNTNTTPLAGGGVGKVVVQILTNTSNAVVATEQNFTALFPNTTISSNSTGTIILPAGTYYTKVSIAKFVDTPFRAIAGRLFIEVFPE